MKKLKDLNLNVIEDNNALTIQGGCGGEETEFTRWEQDSVFFPFSYVEVLYGDWKDTGCCEADH
ncbi:hypothetical protein [Aquimarina sp. LLG6339-5]|uniref:hypothetical protein n=1 Tax=Aquimarina sp. LLG6339-5 TaxID=3160830 RepID=UPI00386DF8F2